MLERGVLHLEVQPTEPALLVGERAPQQRVDVVGRDGSSRSNRQRDSSGVLSEK